MASDNERNDPARNSIKNTEVDEVEAVLSEIFRDHPQLGAIRDSGKRREAISDQFAQDFLKVFRQKLQA